LVESDTLMIAQAKDKFYESHYKYP
jgi:hypothetical protein